MAHDDVAFVDQAQAVFGHRLGFGREPGDEIGADGNVRPPRLEPRDGLDRLRPAVAPLHPLEDHVVARLKAHMEVRHEARLMADQLLQPLVYLDAVERREAQAVETVARLKAKRPDIAIGADLIAGFPTESDEMAENSLRLIDECDIVMGHIFPYSPKEGTPAALMPQVDPALVKERAKQLREATARRKALWLRGLVGTRQSVLVERGGDFGHAESFAPVKLRHSSESWNLASCEPTSEGKGDSSFRWNDVVGKIVPVHITALENGTLIGEAV